MNLSEAKHAFITGGASGIGLGIATALVSRGIAVTLADIDREVLEETVRQSQGRFRGHVLDTRDRPGWAAAKAEAERALGPVDILVNNAGIAPDGRELADMDPQSFDWIVAINLSGVFNGVSAFAADMRTRRKGHIVNTSSMAGLTAVMFPRIGGYAAAKYAVVALSEVLRTEMAPHDVGVSVLCPGMVPTNLWQTTIKLGGQFPIPDDSRRSGAAAAQAHSLVSAAEVGEKVARGIAGNQAYIITHPDSWPGVEQRMRALEAAFLSR
jgi:NAD(P)-dependent dehydrogenase (short-subunit alcohol dehydrogenase family)